MVSWTSFMNSLTRRMSAIWSAGPASSNWGNETVDSVRTSRKNSVRAEGLGDPQPAVLHVERVAPGQPADLGVSGLGVARARHVAEQEPDQLAAGLAAVGAAGPLEGRVPVGVARLDLAPGPGDGVVGPDLSAVARGADVHGALGRLAGPLAAQALDGLDGDAAVAARRPGLREHALVRPPPDGADVDAQPLGGGADAQEEGTGHR